MRNLIRLIRPQQWLKNLFVFAGILFGHFWGSATLVLSAALAAGAFCMVASAVYVINDILDRESDRAHPAKRNRPIASGAITVPTGLVIASFLAACGLFLGYQVSAMVSWLLILYFALNLGYSLGLKHVVILDVFIIASGFMLRILAGTIGIGIPPSQWLMLCGLTLTLFLGFAKRRAEMLASVESGQGLAQRRVLADYTPILLDKMIMVTAACVIMSYGLYTMSPETVAKHGTQNLIYTLPFVMYGIFRYIYLLHHRGKGEDPTMELVMDSHTLIVAGGWLITTILLIR
jgi:4-hydroxybenzoate polyprenyltransferase